MQQHSQIAVLKDRLLQALDDQFNVINANEVTRIIGVLEKTHVTREDLEKTRLGRDINELRRKTADKDLAKRAKKLIKKWLDLTSSGLPPTNGSGAGSDSAPSSRYASPSLPAFAFSSDSRDSNSFQSAPRHSYSNGTGNGTRNSGDGSTPPDTNDEDSNSSVFSSSLSNESFLQHVNSRSLLGSPSPSILNGNLKGSTGSQKPNGTTSASRKRKHEPEDTLRENLNSIMNSGRRLQSTQELAEKFNIKIRPSLSASSSPQILSFKESGSPSLKRTKLNNGTYKNGFHPHDENSLGAEIESAILRNHQNHQNHNHQNHNIKSLPASPALLSLRKSGTHSATTSPAIQSLHKVLSPYSRVPEDLLDSESHQSKHSSSASKKHKHKRKSKSRHEDPAEDSMNSADYAAKAKNRGPVITDVDRDIARIYAQLPVISQEDEEWAKEEFKFAEDPEVGPEGEEEIKEEPEVETKKDLVKVEDEKMIVEGEEDEYELFEYNEEYETETEEEVEVTDDEALEDESLEVETQKETLDEKPKLEDPNFQDPNLKESNLNEPNPREPIPKLRLNGRTFEQLPVEHSPQLHTEAFNSDDDDDESAEHAADIRHHHHNSISGDTYKCDIKPADVDSSWGPRTLEPKQSTTYEQPDSTNCEISENEISSSTGKQEEPDSTTSFMEIDEEPEVEDPGSPVTSDLAESPNPSTPNSVSQPDQTDALTPICVTTEPSSVVAPEVAAKQSLPVLDSLELFYDADEFLADIELLSESAFCDPSNPFYAQFPPAASFASQLAGNPLPPSEKPETGSKTEEDASTKEAKTQEIKSGTNSPSSAEPKLSSPMEVDKSEPSPMASSSDSDDSDDSDDDSKSSDSGEQDSTSSEPPKPEIQPREEPIPEEITFAPKPPRRKRTKRVIVTVMKKKYRKRYTRSKVKKSILDRLTHEQWEGVNGQYGHDGTWHEFGDMTSAYVFTGGVNSGNTSEENVLHILPYVNVTW